MLVSMPGAIAQKRTTAETTLVGIKMYDTAMHLLDVYGNPDEIQPVGGGGGGAPVGGGGPIGPAVGAGGGGNPGGGDSGIGRGGGRGRGGGLEYSPFTFGDQNLLQNGRQGGGRPGGPGNGNGGGQLPPAAAAGGGGGGPVVTASYTRWVYKRGGGKYGFVLDRNSRVIQIEAIGLENNKVRTRRGIGFGASFSKILRTYGLPDSYDVGGNAITMRYLSRDKVVFRLNRLGIDKPHVVTGILVAAGKS